MRGLRARAPHYGRGWVWRLWRLWRVWRVRRFRRVWRVWWLRRLCRSGDGEERLFNQNFFVIYMRSVCLSVCLFVCSDLEPKELDGFQPNLAWVTLRSLWVTSKYFFGLTPPGGVQFWKNSKHLTFPVWPRAGGDILLRHLLRHLLRNFLSFFWGGDLDTLLNGPSGARLVNGLASQRVRSSPQPAST